MVTSPEAGITLVHDGPPWHFPVDTPDVMDLAGAGDSAVATVAASLAAGLSLAEAAQLATLAAGIVLGRIGTAVVRPEDLIAALSPQSGALGKIVPLEQMAERAEHWRRRGWKAGLVHGCFDPLRAGHIHLLEQTRTVSDRLVVGLYDDASVSRRKGPDRPVQPEAVRGGAARQPGLCRSGGGDQRPRRHRPDRRAAPGHPGRHVAPGRGRPGPQLWRRRSGGRPPARAFLLIRAFLLNLAGQR